MAVNEELRNKQELEARRASQRVAAMKETFLGDETSEEIQKAKEAQDSKGMSFGFFIIMLIFCGALDAIDFFTAGTIGWAIGLIGDGIILLVMGTNRGAQKQIKRMLIAVVGESIPAIAAAPFRTIGIIWSYISSKPRAAKALGAVVARVAGPGGQAISRGFAVAKKLKL
jgi:hypothetical protein